MPVPIDYDILRIIWWMLMGMLICAFAIMDGFDLGVAMLLNFVSKEDSDRRIILNTVGPFWEGNQVWLIVGAGAIFAAWPLVYAVAFSGFYVAMLLVLWALILRPVGFKFRSKIDNPLWRQAWDWCLGVSGFIPSLVFGIAIGNILQGVPFFFESNMRCFYTGTFWGLLGAFPLMCGVLSVCMFLQHGALYLGLKTSSDISERALKVVPLTTLFWLISLSLGGLYVVNVMLGFSLSNYDVTMPSNPLRKEAKMLIGAWSRNFYDYPFMLLVPLIAFSSVIATWFLVSGKKLMLAFVLNSVAIAFTIITVGVSMYPFILPSSIHTSSSLTVWDASSSQMTLFIMLLAVIVFLPIILLYTRWVYKVLGGQITTDSVEKDLNSY